MKHATIMLVMATLLVSAYFTMHAWEVTTKGTIIATAVGIRVDQGGEVIVTLYRNDDTWLDLDGALSKIILPVQSDSLVAVFENMPYDSTYAIQVIHDKNVNGKLDFRKFPFPKPKEGAGVSNDNIRWGPPEYTKAKFTLSSESVSLTIRMRY